MDETIAKPTWLGTGMVRVSDFTRNLSMPCIDELLLQSSYSAIKVSIISLDTKRSGIDETKCRPSAGYKETWYRWDNLSPTCKTVGVSDFTLDLREPWIKLAWSCGYDHRSRHLVYKTMEKWPWSPGKPLPSVQLGQDKTWVFLTQMLDFNHHQFCVITRVVVFCTFCSHWVN